MHQCLVTSSARCFRRVKQRAFPITSETFFFTRNCFSAIVSRIIHFGDIYHLLVLLQINIHLRSSYKHRDRGVVSIISIVLHPCHSVLALLTITMLFIDVINISSILNTSIGIKSENNATRIYI